MPDLEPQTAAGKALIHFVMSLDGFVSRTDGRDMDWMSGVSFRPGITEQVFETTGAILGGRKGWEEFPDPSTPYGGWQGPLFILTHHPADATPTDRVTFLDCDVAEAVRIGLEAAGGKNLEIFSASIGHQLLRHGLVDEIELHIAPVLLGDGIRLFDNPDGAPIRLELLNGNDTTAAVNVRYRAAGSE